MRVGDETYIQIYLCSFLRKLQLENPGLFIFFSVPNGGSRNKAEANNLKMAGLLPGVPDLVILYKGGIRFIELKVTDGSLSKAQVELIPQIEAMSHKVDVFYCKDVADAIAQASPIMLEIGCDQYGISKSSSSVLASLPLPASASS